MQNMQSTFYTKFLGWELYVHMYNNVHIQTHFSKKQISFFSPYCLLKETVETQYTVIEQKKFYSNAYSEQNIHETRAFHFKKTSKSPDKKGGTKKHTITVSNPCDLQG